MNFVFKRLTSSPSLVDCSFPSSAPGSKGPLPTGSLGNKIPNDGQKRRVGHINRTNLNKNGEELPFTHSSTIS